MAQLNLYKKQFLPKKILRFIITLILALLLETLGFIYLSKTQNGTIAKLREEENHLTENEKRLADLVEEQKQAMLKKQPKPEDFSIQTIYKNQKKTVQLLQVVAEKLPREAWLDSVEQDQEKLNIMGLAHDNEIISSYIEELQKSSQFYEINLLFSENDPKSKYKKFSLNCFYSKEN